MINFIQYFTLLHQAYRTQTKNYYKQWIYLKIIIIILYSLLISYSSFQRFNLTILLQYITNKKTLQQSFRKEGTHLREIRAQMIKKFQIFYLLILKVCNWERKY